MNDLIEKELKEEMYPIGLGRPPTIIFTEEQVIRHSLIPCNGRILVGSIMGTIIGVGFEANRVNEIYYKVHFDEVNVIRWIRHEELSFVE